jgi:tryptophanyl-tRNA synthetase
MVAALTPIRERAAELSSNPKEVDALLDAGAAKARTVARATIHEVKSRMGLPEAK